MMYSLFVVSFLMPWVHLAVSTIVMEDHVLDIAGELEFLGLTAETLVDRVFPVVVQHAANACGGRRPANFNPAVTVAMAVYGRLNPRLVVPYLAAQTAGAVSALLIAIRLCPRATRTYLAAPAATGVAMAAAREFVLTFNLVIELAEVFTVAHADYSSAASAKTIVEALMGLPVGASTNPAYTLGLAIATGNYKHVWVKILAQMLGAIAGMGINILRSSSDR